MRVYWSLKVAAIVWSPDKSVSDQYGIEKPCLSLRSNGHFGTIVFE